MGAAVGEDKSRGRLAALALQQNGFRHKLLRLHCGLHLNTVTASVSCTQHWGAWPWKLIPAADSQSVVPLITL